MTGRMAGPVYRRRRQRAAQTSHMPYGSRLSAWFHTRDGSRKTSRCFVTAQDGRTVNSAWDGGARRCRESGEERSKEKKAVQAAGLWTDGRRDAISCVAGVNGCCPCSFPMAYSWFVPEYPDLPSSPIYLLLFSRPTGLNPIEQDFVQHSPYSTNISAHIIWGHGIDAPCPYSCNMGRPVYSWWHRGKVCQVGGMLPSICIRNCHSHRCSF